MKSNFFVEFGGKKTDDKALFKSAKEIWTNGGNLIKDLQSIDLYLKPEENKCFYVLNETENGSFDV